MSKFARSSLLMGLLMLTGVLVAAEPPARSLEVRTSAAAAVAGELIQSMTTALMKELGQGGPAQGIRACSELAPQLAGQRSREKGWRITRVSTRVRNPMLGTPDVWEQQVLQSFEARLKQGVKLSELSHSELVKEPSGTYFRYMKAIGLQPQCLMCHGAAQELAADVPELLKQQYPHDQAIGYTVGALRGAVSIKEKVDER